MAVWTWLVPVVVLALVALGIGFVLARSYVHVPSGHALIVHTGSGVKVSFSPRLVLPVIQHHELMDIGVRRIHVVRKGREGLLCKDFIRADVSIAFFVRVLPVEEAVQRVAASLGAARASRPERLLELFGAKLVESLKTVFHRFEFDELASKVDDIKDRLTELIGKDLNGYVLDDVQIEEMGQTPVEALDSNNVMDAMGIRAITERTSKLAVEKAELECESQKARARCELDLRELLIEIERRRRDALASFRAATGQTITVEQIEARLQERIREVVDVAIAERLGRSSAAGSASTTRIRS